MNIRAFLAAAVAASLAGLAFGQGSGSGSQPGAGTQPAAEARPEPAPGPYVKQTLPRDWVLQTRVRLRSETSRDRDPTTGMPTGNRFEFNTMSLIFPVVIECGSSVAYDKQITSEFRVADAVVPKQPAMLKNYAAGTHLLRWDVGGTDQRIVSREVGLRLEIPMRCFRTEFDEKRALMVPWPKGEWPKEAQATFMPQMYLDIGWNADTRHNEAYDGEPLSAALAAWEKQAGQSWKSMPPVRVAKELARHVWEDVSPAQGEGLRATQQGELSGIELQGPPVTLKTGKGTPNDMALLLTALLRKVGLPARTVIGWDVGDSSGSFLSQSSTANRLRAWVEFALYDEAENTINWVPVDIVKMRESSSRPAPIDRPWRYFGTHDQLAGVAPIAFQFHPPTDVVAYGNPCFWGWFVTPTPPAAAEQALAFGATTMSHRGGETNDPRKEKDDDDHHPR